MPTYSNRPNPWSITLHPFEVIDRPRPISMASNAMQQCPQCRRRRSVNQFREDPRDTGSRATRVCYECRRKR